MNAKIFPFGHNSGGLLRPHEESHPRTHMSLYRCISPVMLLLSLALLQVGCAPFKSTRVAAVAYTMQDVADAAAKQSSLSVVREGTPAYLMLIDGLLEAYPDNADLLVAGCRAYSTYASSFLTDEQQEEATAIYQKAKLYGFEALSRQRDFAAAAAGGNLDDFNALLRRFGKADVPALFCAAGAWASWISSNMDNLEALADLTMLEATMKRLIELDGAYYYGGPHLLMGVYLAAKPAALGGNPAEAKKHFDEAFLLGADKLLGAKVLYARYYARSINDRELFVQTLQEVLAAPADPVPELTLANVVAKKQAAALLTKTEEYFAKPQ